MVVTSNGTLLLTDFGNNKVQAFGSDDKFLSSLSLPDRLGAIALINSRTVVVNTLDQNSSVARRWFWHQTQ